MALIPVHLILLARSIVPHLELDLFNNCLHDFLHINIRLNNYKNGLNIVFSSTFCFESVNRQNSLTKEKQKRRKITAFISFVFSSVIFVINLRCIVRFGFVNWGCAFSLFVTTSTLFDCWWWILILFRVKCFGNY